MSKGCDGQMDMFELLGNVILPMQETEQVPPKKRNCAATNEPCNHENCKQVAIECLDIECKAECCQACTEMCGARCNYSAHQPKKLNTETKEWVEVPSVDRCDGFVNLSVKGKCEYCVYYRDPSSDQTKWYIERHYGTKPCNLSERVIGKTDGICKSWLPARLYGLCQTCKYSNMFVYQGEYKNPIEEPNIYCTHRDGSKNRHCAFPELVHTHMWNDLDSWHREHEYDTCDNYKPRNGVERL